MQRQHKCHLINAASAQSDVIQKITNAYIIIFEVAQSIKGFHHGKNERKNQRILLQNSRKYKDKCASGIIV
jgi:hypothetical protein